MTRIRRPLLIDTVKRLQEDGDELKSAQNVGQVNLRSYLTHSDNIYDLAFPITSLQVFDYDLVFTHDSAQFGSLQQLSLFYSIDQPDVLNNYVRPWGNGPPVGVSTQKLTPTDMANYWRIHVQNMGNSSFTIYIKVLFSGSDSGSWTFTRL